MSGESGQSAFNRRDRRVRRGKARKTALLFAPIFKTMRWILVVIPTSTQSARRNAAPGAVRDLGGEISDVIPRQTPRLRYNPRITNNGFRSTHYFLGSRPAR
jgi:hypothetical protein